MNRAWCFAMSLSILTVLPVSFTARADESASGGAAAPGIEPADDTQTEVARHVKSLVAGDRSQRREATSKLLEIGQQAVEPLAKVAGEGRNETMYHCFDVLTRLLASNDAETSVATKAALTKLMQSKIRAVSLRAKSAIQLGEIWGARAAQQQQPAPPAIPFGPVLASNTLKLESSENDRTIQLERAADGSFSGRIKQPVNGEETTTDIKAADAKELQQKFPDAHRALQKHEEQVRNAPLAARRAALPQLGQNNPLGPNINPNGQLNAALNGENGERIQMTVINDDRAIRVERGDERIEIRDKAGKDIVVRQTRTVDGQPKTDEFKAADAVELKKNHPDAFKLYEQYALRNGKVQIGGNLAVPIQVQIQVGPGLFGIQPGARRMPAETAPSLPGPRTIRAELAEGQLEISDENGHQIRVKLTKTIDGKAVVEEFQADDLKQLSADHPAAAKLYEQYTGAKAP